jgi:MFS family permease
MESTSIELRVLSDAVLKGGRIEGERQSINVEPAPPESAEYIPNDELQSNRASSTQLPPVDGGSAAWLLLAACFATELVCFGGAFSFSIFQEYLVQSPSSPLLNATNVQVSVVGTLLVSSNYFAPALARGLWAHFARWNRIMGIVCIQLAGASLLIASFGKSVPFLIIFMGLIPGVFLGLSTLNYIIWLPQWFFKRRGLALGIAYSGAGSGGILFPFIFTAALREVGFAWTLRIWAGIIMIIGGIVAIPIRPRINPPRTASPPSFWSSLRRRPNIAGDLAEKNRLKRWLNAMAFMSSPLWITQAIATFIASMSFFCISFYLAVYCASLGLEPSTSTGVVAGFNLAGLTGEIIVGFLCDRFPYPIVLFGIGTLGTLSAFLLLGLVQSLLGIVFFCSAFWICSR